MTDDHPGIPVPRTTVNMETGEATQHDVVSFKLMPAPKGKCAECATEHDPEAPHSAQSMFYQYHFYGIHSRWPNWKDAMAHCAPELQEVWTEALKEYGVDVEAGDVNPK